MSDTQEADLDQIVKDVQTLKKDLASLLDHVKSGASDTVNEEARRLYNVFASEGERQAAALAQTVEEKPITSLLIAFAIGFLSGRVLIR